MTVDLLPDAEKVISAYLRSRTEVTDLVADRVYTVMPTVKVWPMVRITRVGGSPVLNRPLWLDDALLQIDAWGGAQAQAREVAETCRAVLAEAPMRSHDDAVVVNVVFGSMAFAPDADFEPARNRYRFDITVSLHP